MFLRRGHGQARRQGRAFKLISDTETVSALVRAFPLHSHPRFPTPAQAGKDAPDLQAERKEPPQTVENSPDSLYLETTGLSSHRRPPPLPSKKTARQLESRIALEALAQTVQMKLSKAGRDDLSGQIAECSTEWTIRSCNSCRKTTTFLNHCDKFFCPCCQPQLSKVRRQGIEWWANTINQPKHVVLTVRNTFDLTPEYVAAVKKAFGQLRRSKFASNWEGGCWSLEVTNEGKGWHVHLHALIEARFIDVRELSKEWAKRVHQDFAIVTVKDCREGTYLKEVTKYTVKGSDLAKWTGEEIAQFVDAFEGGRNFGTFGTLFKRKNEFGGWLEELAEKRGQCECGCDKFRYFTPSEWTAHCLLHETGPPIRVQLPPNPQHVFNLTEFA